MTVAPTTPRAHRDRQTPGRVGRGGHGLLKRFGDNIAVNGVDLRVPRDAPSAISGRTVPARPPSSACCSGLTHADAGTMSHARLSRSRERDKALARVGAIVDEPRFHGHLTGRENLAMLASFREPAARDRIDPSLERVGLGGRADDKVASYSMGMRQRLGVAACLLGDPQLLILDEPMNGLDPAGMSDMREMVLSSSTRAARWCSRRTCSTRSQRTCDSVAIVDRGTVIRQGPIAELLAGARRCRGRDGVLRAGACRAAGRPGQRRGRQVDLVPSASASHSRPGPGAKSSPRSAGCSSRAEWICTGSSRLQTSLESWFLQVTSRLGRMTVTTATVDGPRPAPGSTATTTTGDRGSRMAR